MFVGALGFFYFLFILLSPQSGNVSTMSSNVGLYTTEEQLVSNQDSWVQISGHAVLLQIHITSPSSAWPLWKCIYFHSNPWVYILFFSRWMFFFFFLNVSILSGIRNHLDDMAPSWRERDLSRGTRLLSVGQRKEEGNTRWALDSDYCTVSGWERFSNSLEKSLQMNMEISCKEPGSEAFALQLPGWVQEFCNQQEMIFLGKQRQSDKSNGRILSSTDLLEISRWQQNSLVKTLNWKDLCTVPFVKNPFNSPWVFNLYSGYL